MPTKDEICDFVMRACHSTTNRTLCICSIDRELADKIKLSVPSTLTDYQVIITERYVRHVKNGHRADLEYICLIPELLYSFDSVSKTMEPNKRTKNSKFV